MLDRIDTEHEQMRRWYRCAGLSIVSALPLDELAEPAAPSRPDLIIEETPASAVDEYVLKTTHTAAVGEPGAPWLEVRRGPDGYLLRWPDALDVIIREDGSRMQVCKRDEIDDSIPRLLLCQALSFVLPAHGREGFHASAVEIEGRAVIVSGDSGRGKSTIATALCQAGGKLLADDLAVVRVAGGVPYVEPTSSRTWLVREVAAQMAEGGAVDELRRVHKVAVRGAGIEPARDAVPLGAIYLLGFKAQDPEIGDRLTGNEASLGLLGAGFNFVVRTPARLRNQFRVNDAMLGSVPVRTIFWEANPERARRLARAIIEQLRGNEPVLKPAPRTNGSHQRAEGSSDRRKLLEVLAASGIGDAETDETFDEPLLRTAQVATLLRTSDRTIRTWAEAGKLTYIKTLGGRRLFPASGVMAVLNTMRGGSHEEE